jgi:gas vesicle protein
MESSVRAAFNAIFKELVVLIKCETGSKDLRAAIKTRYKKFESAGDAYIGEYATDAPTVAGWTLADVRASLADADATARLDAIVPLLDVFKTLADLGVAQCILTHVYDALVARDGTGLQGILLDKALSAKVCAAIEGADAETAEAFAATKISKGTDIMSIAKDVSKTINIAELMKSGMDPSSTTMQDMVSNVSKDIQARIDKGEVDQEQLMKEATDLLSSFGGGGGGGLGDMLKTMMGGMDMGDLDLGALTAPAKQGAGRRARK